MTSNLLSLNSFVYRFNQGTLERCQAINNGIFDEDWQPVILQDLKEAEQAQIKEFFGLP
jgi:hypothetical protein